MTNPIRRTAILAAICHARLSECLPTRTIQWTDDLPQTFVQGLLSGLRHPIIGLDHLAAIVGVGALAGIARPRRGVRSGDLQHGHDGGRCAASRQVDLPGGELLVGSGDTGDRRAPDPAHRDLAGACAVLCSPSQGLIHGHALGRSIVGAGACADRGLPRGPLHCADRNRSLWPASLAQRLADQSGPHRARFRRWALSVALIGGTVAAFAAGLAA